MIELKKVSKYYNSNGIVTVGIRNIDLKFNLNEIVAITGESGSGKSTLLNVITGVDAYDEGEMLFYDDETSYFDENDRDNYRKNNVSFIFQKYNIIESYTVLENVMIPLLLQNKSKKEAREEALKLIEEVGLQDRINHRGTKLSGGEKQRCVIARALASNNKILACDEPTGNLDSKTGEEIIKLIKKVSKDKLVLIVTHNYDQVKDICTRTITMRDGEVSEDKVITKKEDTDKEKLDLEVKNLKPSNRLYLALKNLFSTPKKSIFISSVFLVVSLIALLLSLFIYQSYDNGTASRYYNVVSPSRVVVYNKDHKALDKNDFSNYDEVYYNSFYEDSTLLYGTKKSSGLVRLAYTNHKPSDLSVFDGTFDKENLGIILPVDYDTYGYLSTIGEYLYNITNLYGDNYKRSNIGKVTYIGYSNEIEVPTIYREKENKNINNYLINEEVKFTYDYKGQKDLEIKYTYDEVIPLHTCIEVPLSMEGNFKLNTVISDIYNVTYEDLPIVYKEIINPCLVRGLDFYEGTLEPKLETYEASIYVDDILTIKKELDKKNLNYTVPSSDINENMKDKILIPFMTVMVVLVLVCLYFVSGAILTKIYDSKTRDYAILRTLGTTKRSLRFMIIFETVLLGLISTVVSIGLTSLVGLIFKIKFISYLDVSLAFILIGLMLLFSLAIGLHFASKLFKRSVNDTLKAGDQND